MSSEPISLKPFDKGIFLVGHPTDTPEAYLRALGAVAQVRFGSAPMRPPMNQLYNISIISAFRNNGHRYAFDASGNLYKDGSSIASGFPAGVRPVITKGPPAFGAPSYTFLAGVPKGGLLQKLDPSGALTNWGIASPPDGMTYSLGAAQTITLISNLDNTTGVTATGCTISNDTANYPTYNGVDAQSLEMQNTVGGNSQISFSVSGSAGALAPGTGFIQFFYSPPNNQGNIDQMEVRFSDSGGSNYFSAFFPVAGINPGLENDITAQESGLLDATANSFFQDTNFSQNPNTQNANAQSAQLATEFQFTLQKIWKNAPTAGLTNNLILGRPQFAPSPGALTNTNGAQVYIAALPAAEIVGTRNWWKVRILQNAFTLVGTLTWATVVKCEIILYPANTVVDPICEFARMTLHNGGSGLFGAYQYLVSFGNSATGSYSNPNPTPLQTQRVNRLPVVLAHLPISTDPQVNQRIIWRTMGDGGFFYQLAVIGNNTQTTYTDTLADFYGEGGTGLYSTDVLSIIPLAQVNIVPPSTLGFALYYQGTMFGCADSANPGFFYYSAPGFAEGFAGYTALINDDDATVGFATWNNNVYLLSQKGLWQLVNQSSSALQPLWVAVQVGGAPGCTDPLSIVSSPWGIIYRSAYGLVLFNSNIIQTSDSIFAQSILPLFRGSTVGSYGAIGTIVAADFGRDEYYFSDGVGDTFCVGKDGTVRALGLPATTLNYEWDTGELIGGVASKWAEIEHGAENSGPDFGSTTPYLLTTRGPWAGSKFSYKLARLFIDYATTNVETLTVTLFLYGLEGGGNATVNLGNFTTRSGNGRSILDIPLNQTARGCNVQITANVTGTLEIFDVSIEADKASTGRAQ